MKQKIGHILMILGVVLVLSALLVFIHNQIEDLQAGKQVNEIMQEITWHIDQDIAQDEIVIEENNYIGYLSIPTLGLELPVLSECNNEKLKIAPCRYFGFSQTDDFIIAGHNYSKHFGRLHQLNVDDDVYFINFKQMISHYKVVKKEVLSSTDVDKMLFSDYDLTLFTCTYDGQQRITICCNRVK